MYGGIYRPVYLEAVPQQFIERTAIDARADGSFTMDVFVNGATKADTVEAQIRRSMAKQSATCFRRTRLSAGPSRPDERTAGRANSEPQIIFTQTLDR